MLLSQGGDLLLGDGEHREQSVLRPERGEVDPPGGACRRQRIAHLSHAGAHGVEFGQPLCSHRRVIEDDSHHRAAVIGRHRPAGAGQRIGIAERHIERRAVLAEDVECADTVAILAEILVAGIGDEGFRHRGQHGAHPGGVFLQPLPEALIGRVDNREGAAAGKSVGNRVPVGGGVIDPGGVVAATVQQHRLVCGGIVDDVEHRVEIGSAVMAGVRESHQLQPEIGEDLCVVGPARHAHVDALHARLLCQRQREPHRAGAPRGLHPRNAPAHVGIGGAEHIGHQRLDEAHVAFRAEIGFGVLGIDQHLLRRLDRGEHRRCAVLGAIDPDAEVDLVAARIGGVEADQGEEGVGRLGFESFKHDGAGNGASLGAPQPAFRAIF